MPYKFERLPGSVGNFPLFRRVPLAYDSKRLAADVDMVDLIEKLKTFLASKGLNADDLAEVEAMLASADPAAMDQPPDFAGKPRPGGGQAPAMDAARRASFFDRFPNTRRVGIA